MLKKSWKHFWKNGIVQKDSTGRIKSEKYKEEDLEEWTRTRRFFFSLDDLQMVISSLTLITSKLSDVELVSMQELALRPISFSVWVNSHYIVACGGWRNNGTHSSCTVQNMNGHQISRSSMKLRRYFFVMVSIQEQLISIGEVLWLQYNGNYLIECKYYME